MGIFAALAFPIGLARLGWEALGDLLFFSMQSRPSVAPGMLQQPPLPAPTCPPLPILPSSEPGPCQVSWLAAWPGARQRKPALAPKQVKSG